MSKKKNEDKHDYKYDYIEVSFLTELDEQWIDGPGTDTPSFNAHYKKHVIKTTNMTEVEREELREDDDRLEFYDLTKEQYLSMAEHLANSETLFSDPEVRGFVEVNKENKLRLVKIREFYHTDKGLVEEAVIYKRRERDKEPLIYTYYLGFGVFDSLINRNRRVEELPIFEQSMGKYIAWSKKAVATYLIKQLDGSIETKEKIFGDNEINSAGAFFTRHKYVNKLVYYNVFTHPDGTIEEISYKISERKNLVIPLDLSTDWVYHSQKINYILKAVPNKNIAKKIKREFIYYAGLDRLSKLVKDEDKYKKTILELAEWLKEEDIDFEEAVELVLSGLSSKSSDVSTDWDYHIKKIEEFLEGVPKNNLTKEIIEEFLRLAGEDRLSNLLKDEKKYKEIILDLNDWLAEKDVDSATAIKLVLSESLSKFDGIKLLNHIKDPNN